MKSEVFVVFLSVTSAESGSFYGNFQTKLKMDGSSAVLREIATNRMEKLCG